VFEDKPTHMNGESDGIWRECKTRNWHAWTLCYLGMTASGLGFRE
jgi:hypothetical protein